jgi:hypothetical protein
VKFRFRAPVSTALVIASGLVVLLGYFFEFQYLASLRSLLLNWGVILAAIAPPWGLSTCSRFTGKKPPQASRALSTA